MTYFYPNLFIPGAAKSGTTSLHELLDYHPDVCMSNIKEPVYWNSDFNNPKRVTWYSNLFKNKEAKIIGESTTSYMYFPEFIENIKEHFETTPKFIFILRNPIDRCHSHYWWMVGRNQEKKTFKESVDFDMKRVYENYSYVPDYYYHFGLYGKWIGHFYTHFNSDNIKIISLENLIENRVETLNDCFKFLGISTLNNIPSIQANPTDKLKYPKLYHFIKKSVRCRYKYTKFAKYLLPSKHIERLKEKMRSTPLIHERKSFSYPKLTSEERLWLKNIYSKDVNKLKQITGLPFSEWTDFNN